MPSTANRRQCAVIDVGTNSIKLEVARLDDKGCIETTAFRRSKVRIGQGLYLKNKITRHNIDAAGEVISRFVHVARRLGVDEPTVVGTYAFRASTNGETAARQIGKRAGVALSILTGREEAKLAYVSASLHLQRPARQLVIIDFGGGSVEIVVAQQGKILTARSLALGALRLKEQFVTSDPIEPAQLRKLEAHVRRTIVSAIPATMILAPSSVNVVASGGGAETISNIASHANKEGLQIAAGPLKELELRLVQSTLRERCTIGGVPSDRADIILSAVVVARVILAHTKKRVMHINPGGIREGLLHKLLNVQHQGRSLP